MNTYKHLTKEERHLIYLLWNKKIFNAKIVKKHERNISRIEDQILFLYSKGMSTRDIQETIYQMFYCDLDKDTISRITDKIIPEIVMWQQRPLESVYPIMYIDGIRFKIREDSVYKEKSVYLIIGVNIEGKKEILGFWIAESESSKQWLMIFDELKTKRCKRCFVNLLW